VSKRLLQVTPLLDVNAHYCLNGGVSMGEFKFNCPSCSQKIQCTEDWMGRQIQCPACQQNIQVPVPPPAAAPVQAKPLVRPSIALATHQKSAPAPVATFSHGTSPVRHYSPSQAASSSDRGDKIKRIAMIAACVLLIPPAGYFGFTAIRDYQAKLNVQRQQAGEDSDGGRLGHIASLYDALDATDPAKHGRFGDSDDDEDAKRKRRSGTNGVASAEEKIVPPKWTLEIDKVKLQRGAVNGNLAGTNFLAGSVFVDVNGVMNVLSIRQGTNFYSDREIMAYLKLKPAESLVGQTWTIGPDTRTNVPNVVKRWRPNPRFAPQQKSFANGYAMRLEFLNQSEDLVQGRIYLALPDPEQSVIAGQFTAEIRQARPVAAVPVRTQPQQPQPQRRY